MSISNVESKLWNPSKLRKPVLKPMIKTLDWVELIKGALPKLALDSRKMLKRASEGLGWFTLPSKREKLLRSFTLIMSGTSLGEKAEGSVEMLKNTTSIVGVGTGTAEIMQEAGCFSFTARQLLLLNIFGLICSIALILKSCLGIKKSICSLAQAEYHSPIFNSNLITLAKRVCRLALGILGIVFFVTGAISASPYLLLGLSTLSITFSLSKRYFNSIDH